MKPANLFVAVPALLLAFSVSVSADAASSPPGNNQVSTAALADTASAVVPAKAAPVEAPAKASPKTPSVKAASSAKGEIRQVQAWINAEAKRKIADDRLEDFSYRWIQLDDDPELELVAKINDSVRLGHFYVLDRRPNGTYALLTEQPWNVPHLDLERWDYNHFDNPNWSTIPSGEEGKVGGKRLFETLSKSGRRRHKRLLRPSVVYRERKVCGGLGRDNAGNGLRTRRPVIPDDRPISNCPDGPCSSALLLENDA